jgi:hypothetical protein
VPLPHDLVHVDHAEKADVTQWIGQGPLVHARISLVAPHMRPPWAVCVVMVRVRDCVPVLQDTEQLPHEFHSVVWQLTGQRWVLHATVSLIAGQATPPKFASTET